ncbi:IS701-like element ISDds6 family transposase [Deinococcus deserti]|uniref:Putative transposase n=1 Tax=Deinococcus deserti (strain DSM 17065 / CIP 109153 / LMG 22923 / VCD115) TaxID=546414 RepID=C1D4A5_DEIDV|nr:IS701-like element ISDds6 family transposase [Deinococcus deserti]ACO47986.1 putative transposase [Deinococcus deserti VCD115]
MTVPHNWQRAFRGFLSPYLETLDNAKQRVCLPRYVRGLLAPLERKSTQPIAEHVGMPYQRLHHFVNVSHWDAEQIEIRLKRQAQRLCGGKNAVLIIDDTALPKSGDASVGVAYQYCGALGKIANCQSLVTLTLSDGSLFAPLSMRLFLPGSWAGNPERCQGAGVPVVRQHYRSKGEIAMEELDRALDAGVTFRVVLADAGYGINKDFRQALSQRGLTWAVGIVGIQKVFSLDVTLRDPPQKTGGRPGKHPIPSEIARPVKDVLHEIPPYRWHTVKGAKSSRWLVVRGRIADGLPNKRGLHLPGEAVWVVGEKRRGGEIKYYVTNHAPSTSMAQVVRDIKARWACEVLHLQSKEELGLDHFEGRSLLGLEHHIVLVLLTMMFLQTLRQQQCSVAAEIPTLPELRRTTSRALEQIWFGRCPHCGEVVQVGSTPLPGLKVRISNPYRRKKTLSLSDNFNTP